MVTPESGPVRVHRRRAIVFQWILSVVLVGVIAVLVNLNAREHYARMDFTEGKVLSLSDVTREVLGGLDDVLAIQAYISKDIPEDYLSLIGQIEDLLFEYRANAKDKVRLDFVDPLEDSSTEQFVRGLGIEPARFATIQRDRTIVVEQYCAIALFYRDQQETLVLRDARTLAQWVGLLEYELTRTIAKVAAGASTKVGLLAETKPPPQRGQRPHATPQFYSLREYLLRQQDVVDIDVSEGDPIPDDIDTLVVVRPTAISPRERFEIDQYLMRGGKVIFMVDRYQIAQRNMGGQVQIVAEEFDPGVLDMIERYGVRIERGLVKDEECARIMVPRQIRIGNMVGTQQVPVRYPYSVQVGEEGLLEDHPITSSLESVAFQWASPITLNEEETPGKRVSVVAKSSERSWLVHEFDDIAPDPTGISAEVPLNVETSPSTLAVVLEGKFDSAFRGELMPLTAAEEAIIKEANEQADGADETPGDDDAESEGTDDEGADAGDRESTETNEAKARAEEILAREVLQQSPSTRVMVISDGDFISDANQNSLGFIFAVRAIEWFTVGADLVSVRSRGIVDRSLRELEDSERAWIKGLNIAGMPLLVCVLGLIRLFFRRRQRRAFTAVRAEV